jgi:DNA-binding NtrC family response regulator
MVGRLIGFSRQLDILLRSDGMIDQLVASFLDGTYDVPNRITSAKEHAMSTTIEVMVLDDEPTVCERLKNHLEKQGMAVETFVDSSLAIQRLDEKQFHVIVTDLKMKGPTGLDVLVQVNERNLPTRVIIITGYRTFEDARGAEYANAYGFVDKPFRMEEITKMVKKAARKAGKLA